MSKNEIRVKVISVGETKEFGDNGFKKRELITQTDGEYVDFFCFEFVKDKVDLLDTILPDTYVTVHYNLRGRKWEKEGQDTKYFTSLQGWKIEA